MTSESFRSGNEVEPPPLTRDDSHYYLTTDVFPGKSDIVHLHEKNPHHTSYFYVNPDAVTIEQTDPKVVTHRPSKVTSHPDLLCLRPESRTYQKILEYQPYMYPNMNLLNFYDYPFYRDWRYPEQPIDPQFASDPSGYCAKNRLVYPCPKYYSKWD